MILRTENIRFNKLGHSNSETFVLMKRWSIYIILVCSFLFTSCSQYVDQRSGSGSTTTTPITPTQPVTPPSGSGSGGTIGGGSGSSTTSYIKFFNPVNFGSIGVSLNNSTVGTIGQYAATATYYTAVNGSNTISITQGGYTILNVTVDLVAGNYYSCFVYKVGYDWKINIIKDDLTLPGSKATNVRVLDFRTQAYYDFVRINIFSLGLDQYVDSNRHFLDHTSFDFYTKFHTLTAGSSYNIFVYNDSANLASKKGVPFLEGKIYSVILTTDATLSAADALKKISLEIEQHN